jgi:hypothetical protein
MFTACFILKGQVLGGDTLGKCDMKFDHDIVQDIGKARRHSCAARRGLKRLRDRWVPPRRRVSERESGVHGVL